ncbi:MAG: beta-N-acetylhexosaminidase [Cocleimonas sp.]
MRIAPMMLDVEGIELTAEEKELLEHPLTGGVILFTRNYESTEQLEQLVASIRNTSNKDLLIAVDHEGGRVQRFQSEFTPLPAIATLSSDNNNDENLSSIKNSFVHGWLMAAEVRAMDIDFSFAPVLDINFGVSEVIGDRAFNRNPQLISKLATEYIKGMREAGMASTGKHFPGHGAVVEDSHLEIPVDKRGRDIIWQEDIIPFAYLIKQGLDAIMPAHVIYQEIDDKPAGFSTYWLQQVLRKELGFNGAIFSDDLSMEGASAIGGFTERAEASIEAGCDMFLMCNSREGVIEIIDNAHINQSKDSSLRLTKMKGKPFMNRSALLDTKRWAESVEQITTLV